MFASQLIYTNCSGWSVWSKSADITENEEDEIRKTMQYKPPENLPYKPTQTDLDTSFPKKFSYFYLSSGKVCLAQSTYIGRVYKDGDFRMGNYIIHALVFKESEDVVPMDYIKNNLFKEELKREEWHDQAAPEELQKIEIRNHINISGQDVNSFLDEDENRSEEFKLLLQSIIDTLNTDQKITFYDEHKNLKCWYKAISLCLPKSIQKGLTFNTFANIGGKEVKIRNIIPDANNAFDYRTEKYAFDFKSKIFPSNIMVANYVQTIVEVLKKDVTKVAILANKIGEISERCNIDLDSALDIYFLLHNQIEEVNEISKLNKIIRRVEECYPDVLFNVANNMYEYSLETSKWTLSEESVEIYRFIFKHSNKIAVEDIINQYISNQETFGVKKNFEGDKEQVLENYCALFKSNAPFAWEKIIDYIFDRDNLEQYMGNYEAPFDDKFLLVFIFVDLKDKYKGQKERSDIAEGYFKEIIKDSIKNKELKDVLCLMYCISKYDEQYPYQLIEGAYSSLSKDENMSDVWDPDFTLNLAEKYDNWDSAVELVSSLILEKKKDENFIKLYAERKRSSDKDKKDFYSSILKKLDGNENYVDFIDNVKKYDFKTLSEVKWEQLQEYYAKYVVTGKDDTCLFREKLKEYFLDQHGKKRIEEIIRCYDTWVQGKASEKKDSDRQVIDAYMAVIEHASSDASLKEYIRQSEEENIKKLYSVFADEKHRVLGDCKAIEYGKDIKQVVAEMKSSKKFPSSVEEFLRKFKSKCNDLQQFDNSCGKLFVEMYLTDVFELYFILQDKDRDNFEQIYGGLFKPLFVYENFWSLFYGEMKKLDKKQQELFLWDTIVYECCSSDKLNNDFKQEIKEFMKQYQKESRNILDKINVWWLKK